MIELSREEKLDLMRSLNREYLDTPEDMLAVVEGRLESSGAFNRDKLFVRSLERIHWEHVLALWGLELTKRLYTPKIAQRVWPKERRRYFDFAFAVLRREPVSPTGWSDEYFITVKTTVNLTRLPGSKSPHGKNSAPILGVLYTI